MAFYKTFSYKSRSTATESGVSFLYDPFLSSGEVDGWYDPQIPWSYGGFSGYLPVSGDLYVQYGTSSWSTSSFPATKTINGKTYSLLCFVRVCDDYNGGRYNDIDYFEKNATIPIPDESATWFGYLIVPIYVNAQYSVTLDANGGEGGTSSVTATQGSAMPALESLPTRTGYTFAGYYDAKSGGTKYYNANGTSAKNWDKASAATLYARWTAKKSALTFDANGGSGTMTTGLSATYGSAMPTPVALPTRTGYTFAGFYDAKSGGTQYYTSAGASARNWNKNTTSGTTLYAHWTANTYTVTLNQQSGTGGTSSVTATYGSAMPTATMPTRTGYTFAGYYDATSGGTQYYTAAGASARSWNKTAATTLYARWTANTYTVTLNKQSGTGGTDSVTATYNAAMPALESLPMRTGYAFNGYYDAASGGTQYYKANGASAKTWDKTAATTLYAQWTANKYELGYDNLFLFYDWRRSSSAALNRSASGEVLTLGDGTVKITTGTVQHVRTKYGASADFYNILVQPNTTYRFSCTLEGISQASQVYWVPLTSAYAYVDASPYYRSLTANGAEGDKTATFTTPANCAYVQLFFDVHDVNVYMTFKNIKLTKETPFGSVTATAVRKSYTYNDNGTTKYGTLATATRTGYTFAGWYTAESGGNQVTENSSVLPQCSTVWSRWTANTYYVAFNANGGTGTMSNETFTYGTAKALTANSFTRTGYTFAGWATSASGAKVYNDKQSVSNLTATSGATVTLYAKWTANTYTVTLDKQSGTGGTSSVTATYDSAMPTATMPTRSGYTFAGYYDATSGGTQYYTAAGASARSWNKTAATTLYARWTANTYYVAFNANGGTGTMSNETFTYGTAKALTANSFTRTGYTFAGWATSESGAKVYNDKQSVSNLTTTSGATVTLYATWTAKTYTLTLNPNGGTYKDKTTAHTIPNASQPTEPTYAKTYYWRVGAATRAGYTFKGWYTATTGGQQVYDANGEAVKGDYWSASGNIATWIYDGNVTVYAQWTANEYQILFDNSFSFDDYRASSSYAINSGGTLGNDWVTLTVNTDASHVDTKYSGNTDSDTYYSIPVAADTQYRFVCTVDKFANVTKADLMVYYVAYDANGAVIKTSANTNYRGIADTVPNTNRYSGTFTPPSGTVRIQFIFRVAGTQGVEGRSARFAYMSLYKTDPYSMTDLEYWDRRRTFTYSDDASATYESCMSDTWPTITRSGYALLGWYTTETSGGTAYSKTSHPVPSNLQLWSRWTANAYTVVFNANGGTGTMEDQPFTYGVAQALTANAFTRTGHTFAGWNTKSDGTGTSYSDKQSVSNLTSESGGSVVLYARWTAKTSALTLDMNNGSGVCSGPTATYGSAMPTPVVTPSSSGYTFLGYYDAKSGGTQYYTAEGRSAKTWDKDTTSGTTLYAHWSANTYTVTLDKRSGTGGTDSVTATYGSAMPTATMPTRIGYTFTGYSDARGVQYYTAAGASARTWNWTGAATLYARWTANTYSVTMNQQSGSGGTSSVTATYDSAMPTATMPTRTGYTFAGYYDATSGGTQYYTAAGASAKTWDKTAATTLYAQWTANEYTVAFDANGGSGTMEDQPFEYGEQQALTANAFTRSGYTFAGWNTKADGSGEAYVDKETVANLTAVADGTVTLYAQWGQKVYKITVTTSGGGTVSGGGDYPDGATATLSAAANTGYSFSAWSDGTSSNPRSVTVHSDATYSAIFAANTYTVTLDKQSGSGGTSSVTATYGSAMPTATMPTRTGYIFLGYYDATSGGTQYYTAAGASAKIWDKAAAATLYAQWDESSYIVSFNVNGGDALPSGQTSKSVEYDTPYGTLPSPTRTGYTFAGWYTEATGGTLITAESNVATASDHTLYAHWAGNTYTVTLDKQSGTGGTSSVTATYGSAMPALASLPSRGGYTFGGYYTSTSGAGNQYYSASGTSLRVWDKAVATTLYANWTANTYTLTLNENYSGAPAATTKNVVYGQAYGALPTPVREKYEFLGWFTETSGGTKITESSTYLTQGAQTIYAHWQPAQYTIAYVLSDGGTFKSSATVPTSYTYGIGATLPTASDLDLADWAASFDKWSSDIAGTDTVTAISASDFGNKIFYAQWTPKENYIITYNPGSQGVGSPKTAQKVAGEDLTLGFAEDGTAVEFVRTGYTLSGWSLSDGGPYAYPRFGTYTLNQSATLYPVWSSDILSAVFYTTETTPPSAFATVEATGEINVPYPPAVEGKTFLRYGPSVNNPRNNVLSLRVQIGDEVGGQQWRSLNRATYDSRTLDSENAYLDKWSSVTATGTSVETLELTFKEYTTCGIRYAVEGGSDSGVWVLDTLISGGLSNILYLSKENDPSSTKKIVIDVSFAEVGSSNLEYFAFYGAEVAKTHKVEFWHYSASGAKVVDLTETVEDGAQISSDTLALNTPSIGQGGAWAGNWVPAFTSTPITVTEDLTFEYQFSLSGEAAVAVNWEGGTGGQTSLDLIWGHSYPDIAPLAKKEGFALVGINLAPLGQTSEETTPSHASDGKARAYCVSAGLLQNPGNYSFVAVWDDISILISDIAELREKAGIIPTPFASVSSATARFAPGEVTRRRKGPTLLTASAASVFAQNSKPTFYGGFGGGYATAFPAAGASVVTRKMVNELGRLGTQEQFFEQCGGYRTFDPEVVSKMGDYPQGAILKFFDPENNALRTVRAVKPNSVDFRSVGVDGTNWEFVDDNPSLSVSVDYSDFVDLSDSLFVETGLADYYEVPFDSYLQLFAVGVLDCDSLRRPSTEDVKVAVGYDGEKIDENRVFSEINGMYFTNGKGISYLDIFNEETGAFGSVPLGGFSPFLWSVCSAYFGYVHFEKICPLSPFSCGVFLSRNDKIRIRNTVVDTKPESLSLDSVVHDRIFTDETLRRIYPVRFAQLYRRGLTI